MITRQSASSSSLAPVTRGASEHKPADILLFILVTFFQGLVRKPRKISRVGGWDIICIVLLGYYCAEFLFLPVS